MEVGNPKQCKTVVANSPEEAADEKGLIEELPPWVLQNNYPQWRQSDPGQWPCIERGGG